MTDNIFLSAFDAEASLIGCLLVEPAAVDDVAEIVTAEDFASDLYHAFF